MEIIIFKSPTNQSDLYNLKKYFDILNYPKYIRFYITRITYLKLLFDKYFKKYNSEIYTIINSELSFQIIWKSRFSYRYYFDLLLEEINNNIIFNLILYIKS